MTKIGVGHSTKRSAVDAGADATRAAMARLDGETAKAVLVFSNPGYNLAVLLDTIRGVAGPGAVVCGCSSEGTIFQGGCNEQVCAVNVMAIASDTMEFHAFNVPGFSADPAACGAEIARQIGEFGPRRARAAFVFPDGVTGNTSAMLRSLDAALPFPIPIAGGAAGDLFKTDNRKFVTHQYCGSEATTDSISVLVLGGSVTMDVTVSHGCTPLGLDRTVTSADGGWVHEIDGRPAWAVMKEYIGDDAIDLMSADIIHLCIGEPLAPALRAEAGAGFGSDYLIRTPLVLSDDQRSLFFPGGLQLGNTIRFTRRDPKLVSENAEQSALALARRRPGQTPVAVLQFDCAGRGRMLFGDGAAENAVLPVQRAFGSDMPWLGFFTYGEIAQIGAQTYYHNYTVVLCALYEM